MQKCIGIPDIKKNSKLARFGSNLLLLDGLKKEISGSGNSTDSSCAADSETPECVEQHYLITAEELSSVMEARRKSMNGFYSDIESKISSLTVKQILNLRTNSIIGIQSYAIVYDYIKDLPDADLDIADKNLSWLKKLRKLAIDEQRKRGIR